ncbi:MAG: DUF11 domain-containing protein [Methanobacteriaceae archaeon]|nr:DUF11 domain-containing protein [Methanobacteriaceae archaeon]
MTDESTDLGVSITGNASSLGIGDTVHLVISLSNLGPKVCDAKLNYKIPVGLKLLSSQGPGVYDVASGVWDAGLLSLNDSVSLDLVLQATNIGYFVNMVSVYGDLTSTHASVFKPTVKVFNGKWKSTAAMSDSNNRNNKASFSFDARSPTYQTPSHEYKWPGLPDPTPTPTPQPDQDPQPTPKPKDPPKPTPSNDQLPRDIASVRDIAGGVKDAKIADWTLNPFNDDTDESKGENGDEPWLLYAIILLGALIGCALAIIPNKSGEYLQLLLNSILGALSTSLMYLTWIGVRLADFIMSTTVRYGKYMVPTIEELLFTPITGVGPTTIIGLGLRNLAVRFPALEKYVAPAIYMLDQLSLQELSQKFNDLVNKYK